MMMSHHAQPQLVQVVCVARTLPQLARTLHVRRVHSTDVTVSFAEPLSVAQSVDRGGQKQNAHADRRGHERQPPRQARGEVDLLQQVLHSGDPARDVVGRE